MQSNDGLPSNTGFGHRHTQSYAVKSSTLSDGNSFSNSGFHSSQPSVGAFSDRYAPQRSNIQSINTTRTVPPTSFNFNNADLQSPQTGFDMNFTPLLPSQLLMGSPFQPGSPSSFQSPQFQNFPSFSSQGGGARHAQQNSVTNAFQSTQGVMSPTTYQSLVSPTGMGQGFYGNIAAANTGFSPLSMASLGGYGASALTPGLATGTSRTVYLGNVPPGTSAEEILSHVRSGQIESVRLLPDKNCAFISFLDAGSATHFHSDAILKKLCIKGQDIKVGWGKPSSVPTSVALAVQQSGASRNVYLGSLPEEVTEDELREELSKFGPIDTVKIVREKAIGFVHFLSIGNAIKAVTQLPQEPKWQAPRKVYYGKDRCAYVSKTQQQNAAQYLGIAPGYANSLNGADRELISNALAQQSVAAAAVATTAGGVNNLGNRTVYLGNIHPETTIGEICNVVRGGLLHHIRYIPEKHICFVTFIDPTAAASFYALSNLQGLMIHNRRLKIGWGKHSGALPPAIALAVSGGASRNVYVGNLDESWTEDHLRQDFQEYGEIELINTLREKSCAFVNFTNIANAIKAIEAVRGKEEYKRFKVNFGKDRCGNPPRQVLNAQQLQQQQQQSQQQENGGLSSPSTMSSLQPSRGQNSISPASSGPATNGYNPLHGPTASTVFNAGGNNPLTMYLAATQQNAQAALEQQQQQQQQQHQRQRSEFSPSAYSAQPFSPPQSSQPAGSSSVNGHSAISSTQQAFYNSPNEVTTSRSAGLEPPSHRHHHHHSFAHSSHSGMNLTTASSPSSNHNLNGNTGSVAASGTSLNNFNGLNSSSRNANAQHSRTVSLPAFSLQIAQPGNNNSAVSHQTSTMFNGLGTGLTGGYPGANPYGLGVSNEPTLPGWAEEEVA